MTHPTLVTSGQKTRESEAEHKTVHTDVHQSRRQGVEQTTGSRAMRVLGIKTHSTNADTRRFEQLLVFQYKNRIDCCMREAEPRATTHCIIYY